MSGAGEEPGAGLLPGTSWRITILVVMALLGAATLVALIVTLGNANRARDRALQLQAHSYEVMILSRTLAGTMAQSEASLGRYVISVDKAFGRQYADQWQTAGFALGQLDRATRDNAQQQMLIDQLRDAYERRDKELSLIALSTSYKQNAQALARYYQAGRSPALVQIKVLLERIIERERALLQRRSGEAARLVAKSSSAARVLAVFGILIVVGAIVLGALTVRAMSERAHAAAEADAERRRSEELELAVRTATDELRLQEARLGQVQKMEAVGQLTGGIAHDFNNMLAVVLGGLELAKRSLADPAQTARHIDNATEGANRAAALTRRLLAFSREDALNLEAIDVGNVIATMSDLLDRTLGDGVTVAVRDAGMGWHIRADHFQLENVLLNLAVNARDAMDGRGRLTIATAGVVLNDDGIGVCAAGEYISITVSDTGCGIAPEIIERVFEPFFTTKPVGKGTGLGLSQTFAFTRAAGGDVVLHSAPGEGTTITLYLPRYRAITPAAAAAPVPLRPEAVAALLDVLVVEDDPRVLAATVGALEELGHRPYPCPNPLAAPALLDTLSIDLILSDVLMPGQTGPEMVAALPARHADIAVLFVTGYAGEDAAFGDHAVLRKPFTMAALERGISLARARRGSAGKQALGTIAAE